MKKDFFNTSVWIFTLDDIRGKLVHLKNRSNNIYPGSVTRAILVKWQNLMHLTWVWVQNSFLCRACLLIEKLTIRLIKVFLEKVDTIQLPPETLYYSKFVQFFIASYCGIKEKLQCYSKTSTAVMVIGVFKKEFNASLVKASGIILTLVIGVNVLLSILFQKPISLWGGFMRVLLLILGMGAIFCQADLADIKRNSFFLRIINHYSGLEDPPTQLDGRKNV